MTLPTFATEASGAPAVGDDRMKEHLISAVEAGSIAEELEIGAGDKLLSMPPPSKDSKPLPNPLLALATLDHFLCKIIVRNRTFPQGIVLIDRNAVTWSFGEFHGTGDNRLEYLVPEEVPHLCGNLT